MNLHSIIEAALPGPWEAAENTVEQRRPPHDCVVWEATTDNGAMYIATFDPTLTAAMLAVCEAAGGLTGVDARDNCFMVDACQHDYCIHGCEVKRVLAALCALESLLTERGLTMGGD